MKHLASILILIAFTACVESKKENYKPTYKIVCGDSIEQERFDENGNSLYLKIPGICDTVEVILED